MFQIDYLINNYYVLRCCKMCSLLINFCIYLFFNFLFLVLLVFVIKFIQMIIKYIKVFDRILILYYILILNKY